MGREGNPQVGNEFSSVEALWSQFEGVMGHGPEEGRAEGEAEPGGGGDETKTEGEAT